jgi:uncharacterized protein YndB with AHSA1/START domain
MVLIRGSPIISASTHPRFCNGRRDGVDYKALGEYVEFDRPRRLVFTFGMPQFSAEFARVVVEIALQGTGSLLTVTQEHLPGPILRRPSGAGAICSASWHRFWTSDSPS